MKIHTFSRFENHAFTHQKIRQNDTCGTASGHTQNLSCVPSLTNWFFFCCNCSRLQLFSTKGVRKSCDLTNPFVRVNTWRRQFVNIEHLADTARLRCAGFTPVARGTQRTTPRRRTGAHVNRRGKFDQNSDCRRKLSLRSRNFWLDKTHFQRGGRVRGGADLHTHNCT